MKIAVAQLRPIVGAVEHNLDRHLAWTEAAVRNGAGLIMFPELSLIGYEPQVAAKFARLPSAPCFNPLQSACDRHHAILAVGVPSPTGSLPHISTYVFRPSDEPFIYSKMYLHPDEQAYFLPGETSPSLIRPEPPVAMAICFEISVPQHAMRASEAGAIAYVASTAKTADGVTQASRRLSQVAAEFAMPTFLSNCLGVLDGAECTGSSAVWDRKGRIVAQLDDSNEGVIVFDCDSEDAVVVVE